MVHSAASIGNNNNLTMDGGTTANITNRVSPATAHQNQGTGSAVNNRNPPPLPVENPPPIENLKMVKLPFYDVVRPLTPVYLAPSSLSQPAQRNTFDLILMSWERDIFKNQNQTFGTQDKVQRPGQEYHLVLRFSRVAQEVPQQRDEFPPNIRLYVNRLRVQLPEADSSELSRQVKLIPGPVEVTRNLSFASQHFVAQMHSVTVYWAREEYYPPDKNQMFYVFPFIVRKSTATFLIEKLKRESSLSRDTTCDLIRRILGAEGGHADICAPEPLKVSLNCPLGKIRMTNPCRSTKCRHVQCFDALNFLQMYEKVAIPKLRCPVCNVPVKVQDLRLDEYFLDILRCPSIMDTGSDIEIFKNCLWKSAEIPKQKNYDRKTIDIELIDDSDDEEKAKAKPAEELALVAPACINEPPIRWAIRHPLPLKRGKSTATNSNNSSHVGPIFGRGSITISDRNSSASSTPNTGTARPQVITPPRPSASVSSPEVVDLCDMIFKDIGEPAAPPSPPPPSRPSQPSSQRRPTQKPGFVPLAINAPNLSAFNGSRPPQLNFSRPSPPNPVPLGQSARESAPVIVILEEDVTDHRATPVGVDIHLQETLPIIDASSSPDVPVPAPTSTSSSVMLPQSPTPAQTPAQGNNVAVEAENGDGGTGVSKAKKARKEPKSKVNDKEAAAAAKPPVEKKSKPKKRAQKEKEDSPQWGPIRRSGRMWWNVNKR